MKKPLKLDSSRASMAPQVGLEPTTLRLTAECSAIELLRTMDVGETFVSPTYLGSGDDLPSRAVSSQVLSACGGLTSVFGMGTGGTLQLLSPEIIYRFQGDARRWPPLRRLHAPLALPLAPAGTLSRSWPSRPVSGSALRFRPPGLPLFAHPENRTGKVDLDSTKLSKPSRSSPRPISISTLNALPRFHV